MKLIPLSLFFHWVVVPSGFILMLAYYAAKLDAGNPTLLLVSIVNFIISLASLTFYTSPGRKAIASAFFWVFHFTFLAFVPLLQVLTNVRRYSFPEESQLAAMGIVLASGVAWHVGRMIPVKSASFVNRPPSLSYRGVVVSTALALVIAGVGLFLAGGVDVLFTTRTEYRSLTAGNTGIANGFRMLINVPVLVPLYYLANIASSSVRPHRFIAWSAFAGLALIAFVLNNPILTPRYAFGSATLGVVLIIVRARVPKWLNAVPLVTCALLLAVFPFLDIFRHSTELTTMYERYGKTSGDTVSELICGKGDHDSFELLAGAVQYVWLNDYQYGYQALGALVMPVPREFWHGKPKPTGMLLGEGFGFENTNLGCPLQAELFVNFGLLGVLVGLVGVGWLMGYFDRLVHRWNHTTFFWAYGVPYLLFLLRGSLMVSLPFLVPVFIAFHVLDPRLLGRFRWAANGVISWG